MIRSRLAISRAAKSQPDTLECYRAIPERLPVYSDVNRFVDREDLGHVVLPRATELVFFVLHGVKTSDFKLELAPVSGHR